MFNYIKKRINKLHYKELFLYGAYISIISLALISAILDYFIGNYTDILLDFGSFVVAYFSYIFICKKGYIQLASTILFWIATFSEFSYLIVHKVDFNIIFTVLVPILAFFTMKKRQIIVNLLIYYVVLVYLLFYYYFTTSNNYILHNINYVHTYIVANIYILVFGIFYYLAIDSFIMRLNNVNKSQKMLLNEIHHRVKNNLNLIAAIIGLQEISAKSEETKEVLEQNRHRIESISTLHEVLYKNNLLESIDTKPYFISIIDKILDSSSVKNIDFISNIDNIRVSMNSMLQLGIMLNEMLINSLKHNKNNQIKIEFNFKKIDNIYYFIYCDNSKNVDLAKLKNGFGYNIITLSASIFDSEIKVENIGHLCYNIALKNLEESIEL